MKRRYDGFLAAVRREAGFIAGDFDLVTVLLVAPLFYALFYTSIYFFKTEHDVPIVVVDNDRSELSRSLTTNLEAHQLLHVVGVMGDRAAADEMLSKREIEAVVYVPQGFEKDIKSGHATDLRAFVNNSRFLVGNDVNKALNEVVFTMGSGIRMKFLEMKGYGSKEAAEITEPLSGDIRPLFNSSESYGDFLIPGILLIVLNQTLLIGLAESVAKEREVNGLRRLHSTANKSVSAMIAGKGALYFVIFGSYAMLFFSVHFSLFSIPLNGDRSALAALTVLLLVATICSGMFLASFFRKKIMALQFFVFTSYPVLLTSGYSWPLSAMPAWLRVAANLLPTTPYFQAAIRITQMGAG
ncbi:MAG TPA: ABC transporter permease, partial [Bacteroidota bacterium]|nr:ABC transporter permease [Bacteroidota bacterium]